MSEETIHETETRRSRRGLASYFRRVANALSRGDPVPADEQQTVTVDPPAETEFEVSVERDGDDVSLELQLEWTESDGAVQTEAQASKARFELFEDNAEEWRWRLVHRNGNIIADGGQGYSSKQKAKQGLRSVKQNVRGAPVETA